MKQTKKEIKLKNKEPPTKGQVLIFGSGNTYHSQIYKAVTF